MSKKVLAIGFVLCVTFVMVSCKKDYQKLSTEFIQQLPDTSTLLVQVENESEHLVYYMGTSLDYIFCFNAETGRTETIEIPDVDGYDAPTSILGVGKENIMIGNYAVSNDSGLTQAFVQLYNLKTKKFKNFIACNWYDIDEGTSQISCLTYDVDRYGDGKCTTEIYDFDGNLLSKKEAKVFNFKEVPTGALAAMVNNNAATNPLGFTSLTPIYHKDINPYYRNIYNWRCDNVTVQTSEGDYIYNDEDAERYYEHYLALFFIATRIFPNYTDDESLVNYITNNISEIITNLPLDDSYPQNIREYANKIYYDNKDEMNTLHISERGYGYIKCTFYNNCNRNDPRHFIVKRDDENNGRLVII